MKNWPTALFASAVVIAMAIVFASVNTAESQQRGAGFMMAAGAADVAWRVNTISGAASYCVRRSNSLDPVYLANTPPVCSAFSPAVE